MAHYRNSSTDAVAGYETMELGETYSPRLSGASTPAEADEKVVDEDELEHDDRWEQLQQNTFNRGSEGRGGWKMLGEEDEQGPAFQALDGREIAWVLISAVLVFGLVGTAVAIVLKPQFGIAVD